MNTGTGVEVKQYKVKQLPVPLKTNAIYWVKADDSDKVSGYITDINGIPYPLAGINGGSGGSLLKEEFEYTSSQTFNLTSNFSQVYSVEVTGVGALSSSQYALVPPNQITILDELEPGDYVTVIYGESEVGVHPYYTQIQTDNLLSYKEDLTNKQNSLSIDGVGKKYPTVDAINNANFTNKTYVDNADGTLQTQINNLFVQALIFVGTISQTNAAVTATPSLLDAFVVSQLSRPAFNNDQIQDLDSHIWLYNGIIWIDKGIYANASATTTTIGGIKLSGDLSGTASLPTVPGLALKEDLANKSQDIETDKTSTAKYPSTKQTYDWGVAKFSPLTTDQVDVSTSQTIDLTWNGKILMIKANVTLTVPNTLPAGFSFNYLILATFTLNWAITSPKVFAFGTPVAGTEKTTGFFFVEKTNSNNVYLLP